MADEETKEVTGQVADQAAEKPQFQLQKLYVKDVSFELPNAPDIFQDPGQAEIKMNLTQRVNDVSDGIFEVVLSVTVTALTGEKTAYLAEVHQAGLFLIKNFTEGAQHNVLNTLCPHTLFPYASRIITDLVADGGFPPLVLQPISFDQVYAQRLNEAKASQTNSDGVEVQGNA